MLKTLLLNLFILSGIVIYGQCPINYSGVTSNGANCNGDGSLQFTFNISDIGGCSTANAPTGITVTAVIVSGMNEDPWNNNSLVAYDVEPSTKNSCSPNDNGDGTCTITYFFECDPSVDPDCGNNSNLPNGAATANDIIKFGFGTEDCSFPLDGGDDTTLPVELLSFTGKSVSNYENILSWETASEINNDHFEIQRSYNGIDFETLGNVIGNGTTTELSSYTYSDKYIKESINSYYRFKQIDFNGEFAYSPIIAIKNSTFIINNIDLFANNNQLTVSSKIALGSIQIYSIDGKLVTTFYTTDDSQNQTFELNLKKGIYFTNIFDKNNTIIKKGKLLVN